MDLFGRQKVKGQGYRITATSCFYSVCTRIYADGGYWNSHAQQPCCSSVAVSFHSLLYVVRKLWDYNSLKIGLLYGLQIRKFDVLLVVVSAQLARVVTSLFHDPVAQHIPIDGPGICRVPVQLVDTIGLLLRVDQSTVPFAARTTYRRQVDCSLNES